MAAGRPFSVALLISTLFHLSMISVFSIVIYLPRKDIHYCAVEIVPQAAARTVAAARRDVLRVPSPERLLEAAEPDVIGPGEVEEGLDAVVMVQLPRLEFADLDRVRYREESRKIHARFSDLFEQKPQDSWAQFVSTLRGISHAVVRWTSPEPPEEHARPMPVSSPAPGFSASIEWLSEPKTRPVLFSPPIQALWHTDPAQLDVPVTLIFSVSPQGRVTEVRAPEADKDGIVADVSNTLWKYRFEPLNATGAGNQRGALSITAEQLSE
jgi:hypothetical protein